MSSETVTFTAAIFCYCNDNFILMQIKCDIPRSSLIVLGISNSNSLAEMLSSVFLLYAWEHASFVLF